MRIGLLEGTGRTGRTQRMERTVRIGRPERTERTGRTVQNKKTGKNREMVLKIQPRILSLITILVRHSYHRANTSLVIEECRLIYPNAYIRQSGGTNITYLVLVVCQKIGKTKITCSSLAYATASFWLQSCEHGNCRIISGLGSDIGVEFI